jgi:hypothetical protein
MQGFKGRVYNGGGFLKTIASFWEFIHDK